MANRTTVTVDDMNVELLGEAPWSVKEIGGSYIIVDAKSRPAKPNVEVQVAGGGGGGRKFNTNVVWSKAADPKKIVDAANLLPEETDG